MKTKRIKSYDEYVNYTESYKNKYYFRGQANSDWNVEPSIFRKDNESLLSKECELIKNEIESSKLNPMSAVLKLQHYGTPTRICDLTISPLSALFFAVSSKENEQDDGVIFLLDKAFSVKADSDELALFSKILIDSTVQIDGTVEGIITKNYIIQYDIRFSYTNPRAILQGGTGLLFGFGVKDQRIISKNNLNIEDYIYEKIIIPAEIKKNMFNALRQIGYSEKILYNEFENLSSSDAICLQEYNPRIEQRASFVKYVSYYQINNIHFNRDSLAHQINNLYSKLISNHGENARIWLFFYFDDHDLEHSNWICRTTWSEARVYTINWNNSYYKERLRIMNEEISEEESMKRFSDLVNEILPIYSDIVETYACTRLLTKTMEVIKKHSPKVITIFRKSQDIAYSDVKTEKVVKYALNFICNVDWLVSDMIIHANNANMNEQTMEWLLTTMYLPKCEESRETLPIFFQEVSKWTNT